MILDERAGIGPHHLSIGKTRKIFQVDGRTHIFYSTGEHIHYFDDGGRPNVPLSLPVAWGGVSFCVSERNGKFRIAFVHKDKKSLCISDDMETWRVVLEGHGSLAAPWIDGERWTVLERGNGFHTSTGGHYKPDWHHSCVQYVVNDVVGFKGFPTGSHLVSLDGEICRCNVNDRTTFHFGAWDHGIAYLDEGLGVSLAHHGIKWTTERNVIPIPCFAPNVSFVNGELNVFACDYHGAVWRWRAGKTLERMPVDGPNISPLFAMTGYGTGGMSIPPEIHGDEIPVLVSRITDEKTATAQLELTMCPEKPTNESMSADPKTIPALFRRMV